MGVSARHRATSVPRTFRDRAAAHRASHAKSGAPESMQRGQIWLDSGERDAACRRADTGRGARQRL